MSDETETGQAQQPAEGEEPSAAAAAELSAEEIEAQRREEEHRALVDGGMSDAEARAAVWPDETETGQAQQPARSAPLGNVLLKAPPGAEDSPVVHEGIEYLPDPDGVLEVPVAVRAVLARHGYTPHDG